MSDLVRQIRRLIMSGDPGRNLALKAALEQLDLSAGRASVPNAFLNLQKIIFGIGGDSEERLIAALEGLPLSEEAPEGLAGIPQIRNALLLTGNRDDLIFAIDRILTLDTGAMFVTVFMHHKQY